MRLDQYLVENKYYETRQKAQYAIKDGLVKINDKVITKPSYNCSINDVIAVEQAEQVYVSRGGFKLKKAIDTFDIDLNNQKVLDIGASTGGFTDCCLQHGASEVYSVDVGTKQLAPKLLKDSRVHSIENLNFRYANLEDIDNQKFSYIVIDVSFISLEHIFKNVSKFMNDNCRIIALIKPQFELYEESVAHKGIITMKVHHQKAIEKVIDYAKNNDLYLNALTFSPIMGNKKDNIEFLGMFSKEKYTTIDVIEVVNQTHLHLK